MKRVPAPPCSSSDRPGTGADEARLHRILLGQGAYYLATGIVPFVSRRAFEAVTGPKREWWLVEAVGAVVTPVGAGLLAAGAARRSTPEVVGIAAGCAIGLGTIDVVHAARGRISRIYLADALVQAAAVTGLAQAWLRARRRPSRIPR